MVADVVLRSSDDLKRVRFLRSELGNLIDRYHVRRYQCQ
jgi:hypothetical protein